jgi:hypothetical protein
VKTRRLKKTYNIYYNNVYKMEEQLPEKIEEKAGLV